MTARVSYSVISMIAGSLLATSALAAPECWPHLIMSGDEPGAFLGVSMSRIGDLNGDGIPDILVGAIHSGESREDHPGLARVFSGADSSLLLMVRGENPADRFGTSVAGPGDVNGDGVPDLVIGAPGNDAGGIDAGRAYLISGATGLPLFTFNAENAGDEFGFSVGAAGDVDGDGYGDIIIGAPYFDSLGEDTGRAYVYSGRTGTRLHTFTGQASGDIFGSSVDGAGDVNLDGYADVISGAPLNDDGRPDAGSAYVYSGRDGSLLHELITPIALSRFGAAVSEAGDVNNDGTPDILVGAPLGPWGSPSQGEAFVYSGVDGSELLHLLGEEGNHAHFGAAVDSVGDVNMDGYDDFIIGARHADADGTHSQWTGRAYLISGLDGSHLRRYSGESNRDTMGQSVAGIGDVNGDGLPDVAIGAPGNDGSYHKAGRVYVMLGGCMPSDLLLMVTPDVLYFGQQAELRVQGAIPDSRVYFFFSVAGLGETYLPELNVTLDLTTPRLIGSRLANADGFVRKVVTIRNFNRNLTVWIQAAGQEMTSNVEERPVRQ